MYIIFTDFSEIDHMTAKALASQVSVSKFFFWIFISFLDTAGLFTVDFKRWPWIVSFVASLLTSYTLDGTDRVRSFELYMRVLFLCGFYFMVYFFRNNNSKPTKISHCVWSHHGSPWNCQVPEEKVTHVSGVHCIRLAGGRKWKLHKWLLLYC